MTKIIKISSNTTKLGIKLAHIVANRLKEIDQESEVIDIHSIDIKENNPAKKLDQALINGDIDIAAHNLMDLSNSFSEGVIKAAILNRGDTNNILVLKKDEAFFANKTATIATSNLLHKSQWLYRYPNHKLVDNNGNLEERLENFKNSNWDGAVFTIDELKKTKLLPKNNLKLGWMLPFPAQATVILAASKDNSEIIHICEELNDKETEICVTIEQEFFAALNEEKGAPIGALARIKEEELEFKASVFNPDGKNKIEFSKTVPVNHTTDLAEFAAKFLLDRNAKKILRKSGDVEKEIKVFSTKSLSIGQTSILHQNTGIDMSDFITIQYNRLKPIIFKNTIENLVFTSQSAVESVLNSFVGSEIEITNIYCVGRRTKRLIERNISKVTHIENTTKKLADYLVKNLKSKEITYLCGNDQINELTTILSNNNIVVNEIESYKTTFTPNEISKDHKGILFFSPFGIKSFLTKNEVGDQIAFCIGDTTATEAKKYFTKVVTSKLPTAESLLKSINEHFIQ